MTSSIRQIRKLMKQDSRLREHSTQKAFASLLECSLSLVQGIERGAAPVSDRLAGLIGKRLGVDPSWVQQSDPSLPIRSVDGDPITSNRMHETIVATDPKREPEFSRALAMESIEQLSTTDATAALLSTLVRRGQLKAAEHNDYQFVTDILQALEQSKKRIEDAKDRSDRA